MADIAVVQGALNTGTGTQTFQSAESWTPKCALFFGTYGLTAGTVADHAMFFIGATDGTQSKAMSFASEDAQTTTDTGTIANSSACILTQLNTNQALDGSAVLRITSALKGSSVSIGSLAYWSSTRIEPR